MIWNAKKIKNKKFDWLNAIYPFVVSICAFICFLLMYFACTIASINSLYIEGLYFMFPCLIFGVIAFMAGKFKIPYFLTIILTTLLIPVLLFLSFVHIFNLTFEPKYSIITNHKKYERVINFGNNKEKEILSIFPRKLPADSKKTVFYYYENHWLDYSQTIALRFTTNSNTINEYIIIMEANAIDQNKNEIPGWNIVGDDNATPSDYTIYVIIDNYNETCIVSISQNRNDIIFYAYTFH